MLWFRRPPRLRHLVASWISYWLILAGLTLPPAIVAIMKAVNAPENEGNVTAGFNNTVFELIVRVKDQVIYTGSVSLLTLTLAIAGPPLILFFVWLTLARRQESAREAVM